MKVSRTPDPIGAIRQQHQALTEKVHQGADPAELLPEAEQFILTIRKAGRSVPPGSSRDLLRSVASYWATFVYQHSVTGTYPSTELEPYIGPERDNGARRFASPAYLLTGLGGALLLALLCIGAMIVASGGFGGAQSRQPTEPTGAEPTQSFPSGEEPVGGANPTRTSSPTRTPAQTSTAQMMDTSPPPTPTPLPGTATQMPPAGAATPTPLSGYLPLIGVEVTNLEEGQEVRPRESLAIQYTNLQPGWSVHLILQNQATGRRSFPLADHFVVPQGASSGTWTVDVPFEEQGSLYTVTPVIAMTADARDQLVSSAENGISQLPEGVIPLPQVLTVERGETEEITETRLVYSSYLPDTGRLEIVASRPDGSDLHRLTSSPNLNKLYPALSPDGGRIAFVGREFAVSGELLESLWLVDADGQNPEMLLQEPGGRYERPAWSPDERFLAFGASSQSGSQQDWRIHLWDLEKSAPRPLEDFPAGSRFPSWAPEGDRLFFSAPSDESGTLAIFQLEMESGTISLLYDGPGDDQEPVMAPDGRRVAFTTVLNRESSDSAAYQVVVYDPQEDQLTELYEQTVLVQSPAWDPESESVYFESLSSGSHAIWMVDAGSGEAVQVTSGSSDRWPALGLLRIVLPADGAP